MRFLLFFLLLLALGSAHAGLSAEQASALAKKAAGGAGDAQAELARLAGDGDLLAQHYMGLLRLTGKGIAQDEKEALDWFLRAAKGGHVESQHNAAVIYERNTGKLRDLAEARRWYLAAAEQGYARSQANLAAMLLKGAGGPADEQEARRWIDKAAARQDPHGLYLLGMLFLDGRAGLERNIGTATTLISVAAGANDAEAQYRMALLHGTGTGVAKSDEIALDWLRKSADQQFGQAEYLLWAIYARGLYGIARDDKQALAWLKRSATHGYAEAAYTLGIAYAEGRGVSKNPQEAFGWLRLAAREGHGAAAELVRRIESRAEPAPR